MSMYECILIILLIVMYLCLMYDIKKDDEDYK